LTHRGAETSEPILMKLEIYDYVRDPTPREKFGGVALCGWSGQIGDLSHLWVSFLSFLLSSCAYRPTGGIS